MNAFRNSRLLVLVAFVAVLALGLAVAPADAGNHHNFHNVHNFHHVKHFHHGHFWPTHYQPVVKYVVKPYSYPVTLIDCYGQPYVVWQTSYQTVPTYLSY
jgi:hypothetical protein